MVGIEVVGADPCKSGIDQKVIEGDFGGPLVDRGPNGGFFLFPVDDEKLSRGFQNPENLPEDLPGMGKFVIDIGHPDERHRSIGKVDPVGCPDHRADWKIPVPFFSLALEVLEHLRLELDGKAGSPSREKFAEGEKKIPRPCSYLGRIAMLVGPDQRKEAGRILEGEPLRIMKSRHMTVVKEMGQKSLLEK
jgi:hypothetical protein